MISTAGDANVASVAESVRAVLVGNTNTNTTNRDEGNDKKIGYESDSAAGVLTDSAKIARPTFEYIHGLAYFLVQRKCSLWGPILFGDGCVEHHHHQQQQQHFFFLCTSRKEWLMFIVRLLGLLSCLCENPLYIFVSPSQVLCGENISGALQLLKCMCSSTAYSVDEQKKALRFLVEEGDEELYRRGVLTRQAVVRFQAIVRGGLARTSEALDANDEPTTSCRSAAGAAVADASRAKETTTCSVLDIDHRKSMALKNEVEELKRTRQSLLELKETAEKVRLDRLLAASVTDPFCVDLSLLFFCVVCLSLITPNNTLHIHEKQMTVSQRS